jgi:hypothetical protein
MLKTIFTVLMLIGRDVLPLLISPKYGKLFQLAYDAVVFVQATIDSNATDAEKREAAFAKLKRSIQDYGISASDNLLNQTIEYAVSKLKKKAVS